MTSLLEFNLLYAAYWEKPKTDSSPVLCGNVTGSRRCPDPYVCLELPDIENPYDDSLSFDSFGYALLATMQLVILDNWEDIYRKVSRWCSHYM